MQDASPAAANAGYQRNDSWTKAAVEQSLDSSRVSSSSSSRRHLQGWRQGAPAVVAAGSEGGLAPRLRVLRTMQGVVRGASCRGLGLQPQAMLQGCCRGAVLPAMQAASLLLCRAGVWRRERGSSVAGRAGGCCCTSRYVKQGENPLLGAELFGGFGVLCQVPAGCVAVAGACFVPRAGLRFVAAATSLLRHDCDDSAAVNLSCWEERCACM